MTQISFSKPLSIINLDGRTRAFVGVWVCSACRFQWWVSTVCFICVSLLCGSQSFVRHACNAKMIQGDEVKKVRTRVPRSIVLTCIVNSIMQFIFAVVLLFYIGPLTEDITTAPLPLIYVVYRTTGSIRATNALVILVMVILFFCMFNILASVSRLVWIFACDNGLPFSPFFAHVGCPLPDCGLH